MSTIQLMVSDVVAGLVYLGAEYADGNQGKSGGKALWAIAEQVVISILTRLFSSSSPDFYNKMIETKGVRDNIVQFAISAISSTLMRRGRVFSHALNSLGATCLSKDLTRTITKEGDYVILGGKKAAEP